MANKWKKYILWFAQEHVDFRTAEFNSIVKLFDLKFRDLTKDPIKPFWVIELPNDEAAYKLASRSVAIRSILELWAHAKTLTNFHKELNAYKNENESHVNQYFQKELSFRINVETYNKHFPQKEKVEKIESLNYLPIEGNVDLKTPRVEWLYIEYWGLDPTAVPDRPEDILFGRLIANGQRHLIKELSLKDRKFIGNTSMDAQLSLLMANQALVQNGDIVFDPFVGSGSLLVSAAKFGGYVLGADIDFMMLHARCRPSRITQKVRAEDESILENLKQYGCEKRYVDVLVADFANPTWRDEIQFDCIITDPPYGIREATEKIETKQCNKPNTITDDMVHYPSTSHYALHNIYVDLLNFSAKHLTIGGRLVCWLPIHRDDYCEEVIPHHENLILVSNSEQPLTNAISRRLLTYEKMSEPLIDGVTAVTIEQPLLNDFRNRYFNNSLTSRTERRLQQAEIREKGRLEAIKRGKIINDGREYKCQLNKDRFS